MCYPLGPVYPDSHPWLQVASTERAMELGKEAAEYVSKTFVKPIKLEFEKVRSAWSAGATHGSAVAQVLRMTLLWPVLNDMPLATPLTVRP